MDAASARRTGGRGKGFEGGGERFEDAWAQGEEVELAFARDLNQASGFQLLDVVRERGGGDGKCGAGVGATDRAGCFGDSLEEFETLRIGESLEKSGAMSAG
jgi:hypothetical protein